MLEFGRWRIDPHRRDALRDGIATNLAGRAFDVLVALIEAQGEVVSKDALIERVWQGRVVEENTVEAQIAAVRRALDEDRNLIRTVTGRGYQFTGEIAVLVDPPSPTRVIPSLPAATSELFGRQAALDQIRTIACTHRVLTLVGAGGVGKTRLAIEAGRQLAHEFPDGAALVELAALSASGHVCAAVVSALGRESGAGTATIDAVTALVGNKRLLLILDNCEHLIESAAQLTEALVRANPFACVIATSREPLRIPGEYVFRVESLDTPPEGELDPAEIDRYGAVQLFDARAGLPPIGDDRELALVKAQICRQLDGIPLAIEFAAARARVFGVRGVAAHLDDRFHFLTNGGRTALPRQKTLRATLDWSHELLSDVERTVLSRLSVFAGQFSIESAKAVVTDEQVPEAMVLDCIANLVEKSLVSVNASISLPTYFLLETTRVYGRDKLEARRESKSFSLRHARHCVDLLTRAEAEWETRPTDEWMALHSPYLSEMRAAMAWCFSPLGAPDIGCELAAAAIPLWLHLSLFEECLSGVERAFEYLDREGLVDARRRMKLHGARGACLLYRSAGEGTVAAFTSTLELAEELDDLEFQLRAVWGLWATTYLGGDYPGALALAERFATLADACLDRSDRLVGDRMRGMSRYCLGDLAGARDDLEQMIERYRPPTRRSHLMRFIYDQEVVARSTLAHALWVQGHADQAIEQARRGLDRARAIDHPPSMCYALTEGACPIALLTGGAVALGTWAESAVEATRRHGVSTWKARGQLWHALWRLGCGQVDACAQAVFPALEGIGDARYVVHYTGFTSALCEQLGRHGRPGEGLVLVTEAAKHAERVGDAVSLVELQRVEGELLLLLAEPRADELAEALFVQATEDARRLDVLAWHLRSATSLARLRLRQGRPARNVLEPVIERFCEGYETSDLIAARDLLESLT